MRLAPRTLFGRNLLLLLVLFVFGLGCGMFALREWVQKPRIAQFAELVARQIDSMRSGLEAVPAEARATLVSQVNAHSNMRAVPAERADPPPLTRPINPIARQFLAQLLRALPDRAPEVRWSSAQQGTIWVRLPVAGQEYWFILPRMQPVGDYSVATLGLLVSVVLFSLTGAALLQRRINRPLSRLADAANRLARSERTPSLCEQAPQEIATVARAFNQMSASLARIDAERAVMLAGVSHDLRTPLAKMRLAIEMLSSSSDVMLIDSMLRSAAEMDAIIDQFLYYARTREDTEVCQGDLNWLVRECASQYLASDTPLVLDLHELPRIPLHRESMRRALDNLIENALRYGGSHIVIRSRRTRNVAELSVMDRGPGIAESEVEALKRPFVRGSASAGTTGSGLGLAIVERIVRRHAGTLALLPREGGGLEARIDLPLDGIADRADVSTVSN